MGKHISDFEEGFIKGLLKSGKTGSEIQNLSFQETGHSISRTTINRVSKLPKITKKITKVETRGRKKRNNKRDMRIIKRVVKNNRKASWQEISEILISEYSLQFSAHTIKRRANEMGIKSFKAIRKALLTKRKVEKRKAYAKSKIKYSSAIGKKTIFADEKKLTLFPQGDRPESMGVKREANEKLNPECVKGVVKHGGGNVKYWGCFSGNGVGEIVFIDENLNGVEYRRILEENLFLSVCNLNLEEEWYFLQDNDPKHKCKIVEKILKEKEVKLIEKYPPSSPDLNPIENLWDHHAKKVQIRKPKNLQQLRQFIREEGFNLNRDLSFLQKIIENMKDRLQAVTNAKGGYTEY